ncbi:MAG TPA: hypothetical protein VGH47_04560 [Xanthobacteraceae bacterium]|jgi:hypothetical protein
MRKLLLGLTALAAFATPAKADVVLDPMLSGTGDNVVFDSFNGNAAIGSFNGQHTGLVDFTDLSGNPLFTGAANGNDIKISNTNDLQVEVFDSTNTNVLTTSTQVFSLKGTGDVTAFVQATDGLFHFDLGTIDPNAQSGFTLSAINGETMNLLTLVDIGGTISDYEHYRIDVAGPLVATTPLPAAFPLFAGGLGLMAWVTRGRKKQATSILSTQP